MDLLDPSKRLPMTAAEAYRKLRRHGEAFFASCVLVGTFYGLSTKTWPDILYYGGISAIVWLALAVAVGVAELRRNHRVKGRHPTLYFCLSIATAPIAGLMIYGAGSALVGLILKLPQFVREGNFRSATFVTIALVAVGGMLFLFRLRYRALYGLSEAIVGVTIGVNKIASSSTGVNYETYVAVLTASVYLLVRGFDNIHQGLTKEPVDRAFTRLLDWLIGKI